MGNWQLEVAKMAIYMAFPVTSFYVYHQVGLGSQCWGICFWKISRLQGGARLKKIHCEGKVRYEK